MQVTFSNLARDKRLMLLPERIIRSGGLAFTASLLILLLLNTSFGQSAKQNIPGAYLPFGDRKMKTEAEKALHDARELLVSLAFDHEHTLKAASLIGAGDKAFGMGRYAEARELAMRAVARLKGLPWTGIERYRLSIADLTGRPQKPPHGRAIMLWSEGKVIYVSWTGSGAHNTRFKGIMRSDKPFEYLGRLSYDETGNAVKYLENRIDFDETISYGIHGFRFKIHPSAKYIYLDLEAGSRRPDLIYIGRSSLHPPEIPFMIVNDGHDF